ncbi:MAG: EAL domain-containing protein [Acetobacteraceae bacterium]
MIGRRFLGWAIAGGFGLVALTSIFGAWLLLDRTRQAALHATDTTLQNAMLIVESVINRELLQVDGALASLPTLFATVTRDGGTLDARSAERLLRGLNFQAFAFRDIVLLRPDGTILASARPNSWTRNVAMNLSEVNSIARGGVAVISGPIRNPLTGDWVLLVVRLVTIQGAGTLDAVAEVPLPLVAKLLSFVGEVPGLQVSLERRDGQLLLSQPYDEMRIGKPQRVAIGRIQANGAVFVVPGGLIEHPTIAIARASLHGDVMIALTLDRTIAMADWERERDRMIVSVTIAVVLVATLALILFVALRQRGRAEDLIRFLARHDALTKLPNRVLFRENLRDVLAQARPGEHQALLYLDLDRFKAVNDTLGHPLGDALLQAVAARLTQCTRGSDTVARLGGDEFAVIQAPIGRPAEAADFAERLFAVLDAPFDVQGHQIVIGTSIGIAFSPQDGTDPDQLMKSADLALFRAKQDGRGVYRLFHTEMDAQMQERRVLEFDLRGALAGGQLELFYQPLIGLRGLRNALAGPIGCEALLRWRHPTKGLIPPEQFIPLAEEIGAIIPIGEWILRTACRAAAHWPDGMKVAVNLSAVQFKSGNLVAAMSAALAESGLEPARLELEVTETVLLRDTASTLATLHEFHALGCVIAMDDFGTGYSSLSYLHRFPFDRIKIDQSFVRELGKRRDCDAIVRAAIALGRELGMAITAEGVETKEQLHILVLAGCTAVQGYLFGRPVPEAAIADLLRTIPSVEAMLPPGALTAPGARTILGALQPAG